VSARPHAGPRPAVDLDALLAAGVEQQQSDDLTAAEATYREVLAREPLEPRAAQLLAVLLIDRNEPDEAIALLRALLTRSGPPSRDSIGRDNIGLYNNLANALRRAAQYDEAEEVLRELVRVAPDQWQPWHNLAQVLKDTGRRDEAVAAIRRSITLNPEFGPNH